MQRGLRYSLDDIVVLARSNHGYGLHRLIKAIYFPDGTNRSQRQSSRYTHALECLSIHLDKTGENLYDFIQDPEVAQMVSLEDYLRITGEKKAPRGAGHSMGGRKSKPDRKGMRGGHLLEIPLPPQNFDWGGVVPLWKR